jgi:hypothetical protein
VCQPDYNHSPGACRQDPMGPRAKSTLVALAVIGALLNMTPRSAWAATQVSGQQDDLQISVQAASIGEILKALSKFNLTYKLPPNIGNQLTGSYSGSLQQALARILDGNDYIVEMSEGGIKVVVLGVSGTTPTLPSSQAAPAIEAAPSSSPTSAAASKPNFSSTKSSPPPLSTYLSAAEPAVGQASNSH